MSLGKNGEAIVPANCPVERPGFDGEVDITELPFTVAFYENPENDTEAAAAYGHFDAQSESARWIEVPIKTLTHNTPLAQACMQIFAVQKEWINDPTRIDKLAQYRQFEQAVQQRLLSRVRRCTMREPDVCWALGPAAVEQVLADVLLGEPKAAD